MYPATRSGTSLSRCAHLLPALWEIGLHSSSWCRRGVPVPGRWALNSTKPAGLYVTGGKEGQQLHPRFQQAGVQQSVAHPGEAASPARNEHLAFRTLRLTWCGAPWRGSIPKDVPVVWQAGIETLLFALKKLPQLSSVPDVVILNMGIWVRDWTASGQDYKQRFETVMQHGNYFLNMTGAPPLLRTLCTPASVARRRGALTLVG